MELIYLLLFGGAVILVSGMVYRLSREMKQRVDRARAALAAQGYAVEPSSLKPIGDMTRFWGRCATPTPLYLQVSNLDAVALIAGAAGLADIKVGEPRFDAAFVARSNAPDVARAILDAPMRHRLLAQPKIRFRTGSIDSLLGADYFPENRTTRDVRELWMIEVAGQPTPAGAAEVLSIARDLAAAASATAEAVPATCTLRTEFFEGR